MVACVVAPYWMLSWKAVWRKAVVATRLVFPWCMDVALERLRHAQEVQLAVADNGIISYCVAAQPAYALTAVYPRVSRSRYCPSIESYS